MLDLAGHRFGKYHLLHLLGEGGYAEVYLAEHVDLGKQFALKVLKTKLRDETMPGHVLTKAIQEFQREAKMVAHLDHPHIIKVSDFGIERDRLYFVMEYAPQGTLRKRHPWGTILPVWQIVWYASQISEALYYAHTHQVVHRDIKPENMLIGQQGSILLSDFGIAVTLHTDPASTWTIQKEAGTLSYMAPECFKGEAQPASDQYSLAIVIYEWLCATPPFQGKSVHELFFQHSQTPAPPLRSRVPAITPRVEQVVLRALAKDPQQRFESVPAFVQALAAAASLPPETQARPDRKSGVSASQRRSPHLSRRDFFSAGMGAATALVGVGLAYGGTHLSPSPPLHAFLAGDGEPVQIARWSPDGNYLASGGRDRKIYIWKTPGEDPQQWNQTWGGLYREHTDVIRDLDWSLDGTWIASGSDDKMVRVWDPHHPENPACLKYYHGGAVQGVAWHPSNPALLLSGSYDDRGVQVWDGLNSKSPRVSRTAQSPVEKVAWSPDGTQIVLATYRRADIYNYADLLSLAYNPNNQPPLGDPFFSYTGHNGNAVYVVAWQPPYGQLLASVSADDIVQVWDEESSQSKFSSKTLFNDSTWGVCWSPNGNYLAASSKDGSLRVWQPGPNRNWKSPQLVATHRVPDGVQLTSIHWHPKYNYYVTGASDGSVRIWSINQQ